MFKKHLLLLLLLALMAPWAANAQTVTIGTGTDEQYESPMNNWYNYSLTEMIYTAEEIAAGNPTENHILSVGFQLASEGLNNKTYTVTVYMKNIDASSFENATFEAFASTDAVTTKNVTATAAGWVTIELENPFTYDPTKNLLIGVNKTAGGYAGSAYKWNYTTTTEYRHLRKANDSNGVYDPTNPPTYPTRDYKRPNVQLTFGAMPTCFKPGKPVATLTPGNGSIATLTWEPNALGTETAWVLQYGTDANFTDGTYTEVEVQTTPSKDLTGLTPEQTYYARVKPECDTDGTKWSDVSNAFTPTDFFVITVNDGTGTSSYVPIYYYYIYSSSLNTASQFIIPAADLTDIQWASINKLTFYANTASVNYGNATFTVYAGETTATTQSSYTDWTSLTTVYTGTVSVSNNMMTIEFDTPFNYTNGNLLIGFKQTAVGTSPSSFTWKGVSGLTSGVSLYSGYSATPSKQSFLPKMTIQYTPGEEPDCLPVSSPTAANRTHNSVELSWTANGDETNWKLQYKTADATEYTTVNVGEGDLIQGVYTLNSLTAATTYNWQVAAWCDPNDDQSISTYVAGNNFTTDLCATEDKCAISYSLTDKYNDSWNGASITVADVLTNETIATITMPNVTGPYTGSFNVCDGREIKFVWTAGSYPSECGFVFTDINDEEILNYAIGSAPSAGVFATYTVNCTVTDCKKPTNFTATEPGPDCVKLNWTENGEATAWIVAYRKASENTFTEREANTNVNFNLDGLLSETPYVVKVRPVCDVEKWSDEETFETTESCPAPYDIVVDPLHESAYISWTGYNDTYTVKYRQGASVGEPLLEQHFNDSDLPTGWAYDGEGTGNWSVSATANAGGTANELKVNWTPSFNGITRLVTPALDLTGVNSVLFSCNLQIDWYEESGEFGIATSSDNGTTWHIGNSFIHSDDNNTTTMPISVTIVTEDMDQANVKFCFYYSGSSFNFDALYIDDIVIGTVVENEWQTAPNGTNLTETSFNLTGLTMDTPYEVKIEGHCGATVVESEPVSFRTFGENTKIFVTEGNWNEAGNWLGGIPAASNNAIIRANVTIPAEYDAVADNVTIEGTPAPTITIKDGGQLHANSQVLATVEKEVTGFGSNLQPNNYVLIAAPSSLYVSNITNLTTGTYDLYTFDGSQELEWRNQGGNANYSMPYGVGHLYANSADVTLKFTDTWYGQQTGGYLIRTNNYSTLKYKATLSGNNDLYNWNLVGNILPHNAYLYIGTLSSNQVSITDTYYYRINDAGSELVISNHEVAPCEAVFVQSTAASQYAFLSSQNLGNPALGLRMNLTQGGKLLDVAIIDFGKGENVSKFQLNPNHTKLYIPQEDRDCAVAYSEGTGEMPVNFKAESNGNYTLSFSNENVEFSYLHLIDNLTGNDVDLLANPSYSFEAKTTDYASRFRLVFATGSSVTNSNFGFINGMGNLCIFGIEGTATLQVIDVTGRIISTETFSGSYEKNLNVAPGVYMLRLINGNDVKVQKMVVK